MTNYVDGTDAAVLTKARQGSREKYLERIRPIIVELVGWGYGYKAMSNVLNRDGIYTIQGKEYSVGTVRHLLKTLDITPDNE
jgi:hypothetical protein